MDKWTVKDYIDNKLVHSLHTSERRSFRGCRRRWNWAYRDMLYPVVTPKALEFGVAFHKAMEIFYAPEFWAKDQEIMKLAALSGFRSECDMQLKRFKTLNGEPEVDVLVDYKERIELGTNMIKFYCETISPHYDQGFRPVEVEVEFEVPITGPQGELINCKCEQCRRRWKNSDAGVKHHDDLQVKLNDRLDNYFEDHWRGLPVTYGGRLDMLAQDDEGRYWIFDWKTTARMLNEGTEEAFLELDDQIASYCWALKTHYNIPVAGFVYVEIKKAYPQPPEELSRLYKGRKYSTNKQFMTTYALAKTTFEQNDPTALAVGLYDDYLNWLKADGPRFHQRHQIHKNDHEIEEIGKNVYLEALDMVNNPRVYPQPGRFTCNTCLFRQPCLGKNMGEDFEYTLSTLFEKKTQHYWEEKAASTE